MKVLVIHCAYQVKGGEDTVVEEEMKLMQSLGVVVSVLLFDNTKQAFFKFLQLPFNVFSYLKTRKKIKAFQPDVVHIHNLHYAGSASVIYAAKKSKIPIVMTLHNYRLICPSAILYFDQKPFFDSLKQIFPWTAIRQGVYKNSVLLTFWVSVSMQLHQWLGTWKYCSRFIVLSSDAKQIFAESHAHINNDRITIKPNFCADVLKPSLTTSDYFFYAGRLNEEKGINVLLETFSRCNYKLKIAGQGPLQEKVVDYSKRFSNIEFIGNLKKEAVLACMQSCTALVFPSTWLEGMPLTIIEAFACGTPVISSYIGVMRYMIRENHNGLFFEPESSSDLLSRLTKWSLLSVKEKQLYKMNARSTYEKNYTPAVNAQQLLSIYNQAIAPKVAV